MAAAGTRRTVVVREDGVMLVQESSVAREEDNGGMRVCKVRGRRMGKGTGEAGGVDRPQQVLRIASSRSTTAVMVGRSFGSWTHISSMRSTMSSPH